MRFTSTALYDSLSRGAHIDYDWRVEFKKTTGITQALLTGTWVDVTEYIARIPRMPSRIELETGQFTADTISLTVRDIAFWDANIFDATEAEYIEVKILFILGTAPDTVYTFTGFVDKVRLRRIEERDQIQFTVSTYESIGDRIAAENLTTQYFNTDIDGSGTDGIALPKMPGFFVKDANISGFVLRIGSHTITYDFNAGDPRGRLDSGAWVTLVGSSDITLGNAQEAAEDSQRVKIFIKGPDILPNVKEQIEERIVVTKEGDILPRQWPAYTGVRTVIKDIYAKVGITNVTFDDLEYDGSPGNRVSFLDKPPDDSVTTPSPPASFALAYDSTGAGKGFLWVGVGNKVFRRDMDNNNYKKGVDEATPYVTLATDKIVIKLLYNKRNNHLWVYHTSGFGGTNTFLRRYDVGGDSLSAELDLIESREISVQLFDFNYTGSLWKYSVVYRTFSDIKEVDGSSLSISTVLSGRGASSTNLFTYRKGLDAHPSTGPDQYFYDYDDSTINKRGKLHINTSGAWVDDGFVNTNINTGWVVDANSGAYEELHDIIFFWNNTEKKIKVIGPLASSGGEVVDPRTSVTPFQLDTALEVNQMWYDDIAKVYFTSRFTGNLYSLTELSGTATGIQVHPDLGSVDLPELVPVRIYVQVFAFAHDSVRNILFGLEEAGRLWQWDNLVGIYVPEANFEGMTVRGALNKVFRSFNLVGIVSSIKQAYVFRRGNAAGVPQDSGNQLVVTMTDGSQLSKIDRVGSNIAYIELSNGKLLTTWDGTFTNTRVLTDVRKLTISSDLIPDEIMLTLAKAFYNYFNPQRHIVKMRLGKTPLFQFEPFDSCKFNLATSTPPSKISIADGTTGVIHGVSLFQDGSMDIEVLI